VPARARSQGGRRNSEDPKEAAATTFYAREAVAATFDAKETTTAREIARLREKEITSGEAQWRA
jgi:hypothetical protein